MTSGYVTDIDYIYNYYGHLNPVRADLGLFTAGFAAPTYGTVCELGFGQGVSINVHAAAQPGTEYWGTDFMPAQAAFAQHLAQASGSGARLFDQAFAEFCRRPDLPDFDYIGLHGVWAWIAAEDRALIVDFVRRKLKIGGVLYVSYNAMPGWAAMVPMRHLFARHANTMAAPAQDSATRMMAAIDFADRLFATDPRYLAANPAAAAHFKQLKTTDRRYQAHEYLAHDWHPMHFDEVAAELAPAKLTYACSAHYINNVDPLNVDDAQQALLDEIPDPIFRETVRDFMVNRLFRRDYWVKGARRLNPHERAEALCKQRLVLAVPRSEAPEKVDIPVGELSLQSPIYHAIFDAMADHEPKTLKELHLALAGKPEGQDVALGQLLQYVMILIGAKAVLPVQPESTIAAAKAHTDGLNAAITKMACGGTEIDVLASPVVGGGITVKRLHQLFLRAIKDGRQQPEDWAAFAARMLDQDAAALQDEAVAFAAERLPFLQKLGIA